MATRFYGRNAYYDSNGNPLVGGKLYFFVTGTSTPKNTYSDNGLTTPNANPVVADSAGRFGAIYLETGSYKAELRTAAEVVIWTEDPVEGTPGGSTLGATTFTGAITMSGAAINETARASIASATTVNIGAAAANSILITGTTTINAFDNVAAGRRRSVTFAAALTLTHNATSLILPGGANIVTAANDSAEFLSLGSGNWQCLSYKRQSGRSIVDPSQVLQIVESLSSAAATGTTVMPQDDTIPQITEGDEYMTVAFTPLNAASKLLIEAEGIFASSAGGAFGTVALFQDAGADAIAVTTGILGAAGQASPFRISLLVTSGSLSARTYRLRIGPESAGTITFNGQAGARLFGTLNKSFMRVTEFLPAVSLP